MVATTAKPRRVDQDAISPEIPVRLSASRIPKSEGLRGVLGLLGEVELAEHRAGVQQQHGKQQEDERGQQERGPAGDGVRRRVQRAGEVERDAAVPQVAREEHRRLGGDEDAEQHLGGRGVRRVADRQLVEPDQHHHPDQDDRGEQVEGEQDERQRLGLAGAAEAEGVAEAGEDQRPGDRALAQARPGVGPVAEVVDDAAGLPRTRVRHRRTRPRCGRGPSGCGPDRGRGRRRCRGSGRGRRGRRRGSSWATVNIAPRGVTVTPARTRACCIRSWARHRGPRPAGCRWRRGTRWSGTRAATARRRGRPRGRSPARARRAGGR